jgi:hypothetical protein
VAVVTENDKVVPEVVLPISVNVVYAKYWLADFGVRLVPPAPNAGISSLIQKVVSSYSSKSAFGGRHWDASFKPLSDLEPSLLGRAF